ncbi:MAG TPA: TonB-dependent receptor [Longimicrobium sp.]|nr:TonB-dependent receptor [Longimicrobium sp.]
MRDPRPSHGPELRRGSRLRAALASAFAALLLAAAPLAAQATGAVTGRVVDAATGRPLPAARVAVPGAARAASAGVDGRYTITGVPAGAQSLTVTLLGYATKTVTGVQVPAGGTATQDVSLSAAAVVLEALTVSATRERGTVSQALDAQRTATGIVNATTAEQIARSPDANAAQAVQRVSGVTVQDGRYIFVRGLGERYTTTSLNGTRLPSPETDRKVVPFDLFPSGLLQSVTTAKTFTPDLSADFSGAHVDIRTREYPSRPVFALNTSLGFNTAATGQGMPTGPSSGSEWLAYAGAERELPDAVRALGDFRGVPQAEINRAARAFRNVWTPRTGEGRPLANGGFSLGGESPLFGHDVGYVFSGSYASSHELRRGEKRMVVAGDPVRVINRFEGQTGRSSVLWGGVANLSTRLGGHTRLSLDNLYNRSADSEAHLDSFGELPDYDHPVRRSWLSFVERSVRSNQLRAEHRLFGGHELQWQVTNAEVTRDEPDRTDLLFVSDPEGRYAVEAFTGTGARRSFSELRERSWTQGADYRFGLGSLQVKMGGLLRRTDRGVDLRSYGFSLFGLSADEYLLSPEQLFDGRYAADGSSNLRIQNNSDGGRYQARDRIRAGYVMLEQPIGRLRVVGGARYEAWDLDITARPINESAEQAYAYRNGDVLPSLALNWKLGDVQNLRLSVSQTLARPEYRELVPFLQRNPVGDLNFVGNDSLRRSLVRNLDLRWERYPANGEVLSIALFAKQFDSPIEQIQIATSGASVLTFVNTERAVNYGVETEVRKSLEMLGGVFHRFDAFVNATVMHSRIRVGNAGRSALTNSDRPMVGQAPYVVNAGLTWADADRGASATLLYNVVGRRIVSTGVTPTPDTYEEPRHVLDFSVQARLGRAMTAKLNARNLLDAPYRQTAGGYDRLRYTTGRVFSLGLGWQPGR